MSTGGDARVVEYPLFPLFQDHELPNSCQLLCTHVCMPWWVVVSGLVDLTLQMKFCTITSKSVTSAYKNATCKKAPACPSMVGTFANLLLCLSVGVNCYMQPTYLLIASPFAGRLDLTRSMRNGRYKDSKMATCLTAYLCGLG
jgi:hypothetical protein